MSNPTTPFSWQMPTATDLVTDLPADFEVFGQAVATSMADLLGGASGYILSKNSATDMDFAWIPNDQGDLTAITAGSGISVTSGTGPIPTVALDLTSANTFTAAQTATRFIVTGSTVATNGMYLPAANQLAFSTNSALRMTIIATGEIGIGAAAGTTARTITLNKTMTGSTFTAGINNAGVIQSDVTGQARMYLSSPSTLAAAFTVSEVSSFYANGTSIGAGSTVTNNYGFNVDAGMTTATNNYGFWGNIPSGTNRWNAYMVGTAGNYFAGQTTVGSTSLVLGAGSVAQQFGVVSTAATNIVEVIRGAASQTGDLVQWQNSAGTVLSKIASSGNIVAGNMAIATSSVSTIHISNGTIPTANPVGGGVVYVESGALKYRGSSGTITTLGAA